MATNLRLGPEAAEALRAEAARTGQSQQELIRAALDEYLNILPRSRPDSDAEALVAAGVVLPARSAFREVVERLSPPEGRTSVDLLDRDDRV